MGESKPIKHTDVIEENLFQNTTESGKQLLAVVNDLIGGFKQMASVTGKAVKIYDPKTVDDIKKQEKALTSINQVEKAYNKTKMEQLVLEEKLKLQAQMARKEAKERAKEELGLVSAYEKQSKQLAALKKNYQELAVTGREHGVVARGLLQTIQEQDAGFKKLDASVGNHHRSIGDYAIATKGLTGVLLAATEALGIDKEWIERLKEAHKELQHTIHGTHELVEKLAEGHKKEAEAAKEGAVAAEEMEAAQLGTLPVIALVIAALAALGGIIYLVTLNTEKEEEAERERSRAVDGSIIKNKELRDSYNEHLLAVMDLANQYRVLRGEMTKYQADVEKVKNANKVAVANIRNDTEKEVQEATSLWSQFKDMVKDIFTNPLSGQLMPQSGTDRLVKVFEEANEKIKSAEEKSNDEIEKLEKDHHLQLLEEEKRFLENEATLRKLHNDLTLDQEIKFLEKERNIAIILARDRGENELLVVQEYEIKRMELIGEFYKKEIEKINEKIKQAAEKYKEDAENFKKLFEERQRNADAFYKKQIALLMENEIKAAKLEEAAAKRDKERFKAKRDLENAEYQKRLEDLTNAYDKDVKKTKAYYDALELLKKEHAQNMEKIDKEERLKRLQNALQEVSAVENAVKSSLERRNALQQKFDQYQIQQAESLVETQMKLAQSGYENRLDFELKEKAKAIDAEKQLELKRYRQQEGFQLASLFLEEMRVYAKDGDKHAAAKALAQVFEAKGLAYAFAGGFSTGTEKLQGPGTEKSDSILALLSKNESVITAKGTRENPGLATAMNMGTVEEYFKKVYMPKLSEMEAPGAAGNNMMGAVIEELRDVKETIKNKKELHISRDTWRSLVLSEKENGITMHYTQRVDGIVPRRPHGK